ncbi:SRPBCC domain-containing protein [Streptomyces sp. SM14]|uniref:SRPBCC domain-containing protein n=1 Tax=Streptomyces sp. SM14 TaxID=1736045 RepID=UPI000CD4AEAD|nr:SRPBCC domain-containing protein [Streptomyces sp. SM14]
MNDPRHPVDPDTEVRAVDRRLVERERDGATARVATISRSYDTSAEDLWDACTTADRIGRWFVPVTGELRLGGSYQLEGNADGTVTDCDPPRSFAATWEYGGDVSWITVSVSAEPDGRSRMTLEHTAHVDDERWAEYGPGATGVGWDLGLLALAGHLAGDPRPADPEALVATPEYRRFIAASSDAWARRSVEAGTPEREALAAGRRTTAFYTGVPEQPEG